MKKNLKALLVVFVALLMSVCIWDDIRYVKAEGEMKAGILGKIHFASTDGGVMNWKYSEEDRWEDQNDDATILGTQELDLWASPKRGYALDHWGVTSNHSIDFYDDNGNVDNTANRVHITSPNPFGESPLDIVAYFKKKSYKITAEAYPPDWGKVVASQSSGYFDDTVTFTATANPGYQFNELWTFNYGDLTDGEGATYSIPVGYGDLTATAYFSRITYSISTSANPAQGGRVSADRTSGIINDPVTLVATPNEGYALKQWNVTGVDLTEEQRHSNPLSLNIGASDIVAEAEFEQVYSIEVQNDGNGSGTATPNRNIPAGKNVILTAEPSSGYAFKEWKEIEGITLNDSQRYSDRTGFTMGNANVIVKAIFERAYKVNVTFTDGGEANATPNSKIKEGTTVNLIATPHQYYKFVEWTEIAGIELTDEQKHNPVINFRMGASDVDIKASFEPELPLYNITTDVEGEGTIAVNPSGARFPEGENIALTAIPAEGNKFKEWRWNETPPNLRVAPVTGGSSVATFTMPAKTITATAVFEPIYAVTVSSSGHGTASASPTSGTQGTNVTLKAIPTAGYQFKEWTNVTGINLSDNQKHSAKVSFNIGTSDITAEAVFDEITVIGIALNSQNAKKEYTVGDALDSSNLFLTVVKSDGSTQTVNVTGDMISGFDSSKPGKQKLTVTYGDYIDTYEIEIKAKENTDPTNNNDPTNTHSADGNSGIIVSKGSYGVNTDSETTNGAYSKNKSGDTDPDTGDHRNISSWILLMSFSVIGLIFTSSRWEKRKIHRIYRR